MKKAMFVVLMLLLFTVAFAFDFQALTEITNLPPVWSFSGEYGARIVDGNLYLAYTTRQNEGIQRDVFAIVFPDGNSIYHVFDINPTWYSNDNLPPTISINYPQIFIQSQMHHNGGVLFSPDMGASWQSSVMPNTLSSDVETMQKKTRDLMQGESWNAERYAILTGVNDEVVSFSTLSDPYGVDETYFTNNERTTTETPVYFWGADFVRGKVRSNDDIWVRNAGGGNNQGWPFFLDLVITSGIIRSSSAQIPYEQIFQGGLIENAESKQFNQFTPTIELAIKASLPQWGSSQYGNDSILMVEANGTTAFVKQAVISQTVPTAFPVYESYPPPIGDPLYTNRIPIPDTTWIDLGVHNLDNGFYTDYTLWLKGTFANNVTIMSAQNIYLIGDILLQNTPVGMAPDQNPINTTDKVCIISMEKIIIKYGYKDPNTGQRLHPNCGPDGSGINIYADLITPKIGLTSFQSGVFTFEYQHPHGSTPDLMIDDQLYTKIDLHRRRFPQTTQEPWHPNLDFPWYNPLWPERSPYKQRGTINLWGSILQNRRGFLRRSGNDSEYPSNSGVWDIENDRCGGPVNAVIYDPITGLLLQPVNFPGASGTGVGYTKNYNPDFRTLAMVTRHKIFGLGLKAFSISGTNYSGMVKYLPDNEPYFSKSLDISADSLFVSRNNSIYTQNDRFDHTLPEGWHIVKIKSTPDGVISLWGKKSPEQRELKLVKSDFAQTYTTILHECIIDYDLFAFNKVGALYVLSYYDTDIDSLLHYSFNALGSMVNRSAWDISTTLQDIPNWQQRNAEMTIMPISEETAYLVLGCFLDWDNPQTEKRFFITQGSMPIVSTEEGLAPQVPLTLRQNYPNPFNPETTISYYLPKASEVSVKVFNVKGQLVRTLYQDTQGKGSHSLKWNGKDNSGRDAASGIYFYTLKTDSTALSKKMLLMK